MRHPDLFNHRPGTALDGQMRGWTAEGLAADAIGDQHDLTARDLEGQDIIFILRTHRSPARCPTNRPGSNLAARRLGPNAPGAVSQRKDAPQPFGRLGHRPV
jgi:hypothetical protein